MKVDIQKIIVQKERKQQYRFITEKSPQGSVSGDAGTKWRKWFARLKEEGWGKCANVIITYWKRKLHVEKYGVKRTPKWGKPQ